MIPIRVGMASISTLGDHHRGTLREVDLLRFDADQARADDALGLT